MSSSSVALAQIPPPPFWGDQTSLHSPSCEESDDFAPCPASATWQSLPVGPCAHTCGSILDSSSSAEFFDARSAISIPVSRTASSDLSRAGTDDDSDADVMWEEEGSFADVDSETRGDEVLRLFRAKSGGVRRERRHQSVTCLTVTDSSSGEITCFGPGRLRELRGLRGSKGHGGSRDRDREKVAARGTGGSQSATWANHGAASAQLGPVAEGSTEQMDLAGSASKEEPQVTCITFWGKRQKEGAQKPPKKPAGSNTTWQQKWGSRRSHGDSLRRSVTSLELFGVIRNESDFPSVPSEASLMLSPENNGWRMPRTPTVFLPQRQGPEPEYLPSSPGGEVVYLHSSPRPQIDFLPSSPEGPRSRCGGYRRGRDLDLASGLRFPHSEEVFRDPHERDIPEDTGSTAGLSSVRASPDPPAPSVRTFEPPVFSRESSDRYTLSLLSSGSDSVGRGSPESLSPAPQSKVLSPRKGIAAPLETSVHAESACTVPIRSLRQPLVAGQNMRTDASWHADVVEDWVRSLDASDRDLPSAADMPSPQLTAGNDHAGGGGERNTKMPAAGTSMSRENEINSDRQAVRSLPACTASSHPAPSAAQARCKGENPVCNDAMQWCSGSEVEAAPEPKILPTSSPALGVRRTTMPEDYPSLLSGIQQQLHEKEPHPHMVSASTPPPSMCASDSMRPGSVNGRWRARSGAQCTESTDKNSPQVLESGCPSGADNAAGLMQEVCKQGELQYQGEQNEAAKVAKGEPLVIRFGPFSDAWCIDDETLKGRRRKLCQLESEVQGILEEWNSTEQWATAHAADMAREGKGRNCSPESHPPAKKGSGQGRGGVSGSRVGAHEGPDQPGAAHVESAPADVAPLPHAGMEEVTGVEKPLVLGSVPFSKGKLLSAKVLGIEDPVGPRLGCIQALSPTVTNTSSSIQSPPPPPQVQSALPASPPQSAQPELPAAPSFRPPAEAAIVQEMQQPFTPHAAVVASPANDTVGKETRDGATAGQEDANICTGRRSVCVLGAFPLSGGGSERPEPRTSIYQEERRETQGGKGEGDEGGGNSGESGGVEDWRGECNERKREIETEDREGEREGERDIEREEGRGRGDGGKIGGELALAEEKWMMGEMQSCLQQGEGGLCSQAQTAEWDTAAKVSSLWLHWQKHRQRERERRKLPGKIHSRTKAVNVQSVMHPESFPSEPGQRGNPSARARCPRSKTADDGNNKILLQEFIGADSPLPLPAHASLSPGVSRRLERHDCTHRSWQETDLENRRESEIKVEGHRRASGLKARGTTGIPRSRTEELELYACDRGAGEGEEVGDGESLGGSSAEATAGMMQDPGAGRPAQRQAVEPCVYGGTEARHERSGEANGGLELQVTGKGQDGKEEEDQRSGGPEGRGVASFPEETEQKGEGGSASSGRVGSETVLQEGSGVAAARLPIPCLVRMEAIDTADCVEASCGDFLVCSLRKSNAFYISKTGAEGFDTQIDRIVGAVSEFYFSCY